MLLSTVRDGFTTRLKTIPGMEVQSYGDTPTVPSAAFEPPDIEYHGTMARGSDDLEYTIWVYVANADNGEAVRIVETYMSGHGDRSVRRALETSAAGDGLDAASPSVQMVSANTHMNHTPPAGGEYAAIEYRIRITVSGTT